MNVRRVVVLGLAVTVALAARATAQSAQPWSLQASVLAANQRDGDRSMNGVGFEGQFRYTPAALWSVGLGFQYTTHSSDQVEIKIMGGFLEPRYAIDIGSDRIAPYLAGRLAFLRHTTTLEILPDEEFSSSGTAFGGGGGLLIRATSNINIDLGAAIVRQSFSDVTNGDRTVSLPAFTGYVAKGGLSIGFGSR